MDLSVLTLVVAVSVTCVTPLVVVKAVCVSAVIVFVTVTCYKQSVRLNDSEGKHDSH